MGCVLSFTLDSPESKVEIYYHTFRPSNLVLYLQTELSLCWTLVSCGLQFMDCNTKEDITIKWKLLMGKKIHKSTLELGLLTCLHKERAVGSLWALKWLWERSGGPGGHRCPHSSGSPGSQGCCWDSRCTGDQEDQKDDPHASGRWKPSLFDLHRKHGRMLQTTEALGTLEEK